ncbi:MAG: cardiolipin synthase [bacterium]
MPKNKTIKNINNKLKNTLIIKAFFLFIVFVIQIWFVIHIIATFQEIFTYFHFFSVILSLIILLFIIADSDINPSYKISWIIPILVLPSFGWIFYLMFSNNLNKKNKVKKISQLLKSNNHNLQEIQNKLAMRNAKYLIDYADAEIFKNYDDTYFKVGEEYFQELLKQLEKAEKFIFMEYFIIEEGLLWNSILDILKKKASEGVEVRLIYDYMGCMLTLPNDYFKTLESYGIKVSVFNPVNIIFSIVINNRTHRKITVIDGKIAFTGGINLADEYINHIEKFGHWKDSGIMISGEGVWSFTVMFLDMWELINKKNEDYFAYKHVFSKKIEKNHNGYIIPFSDTPFDKEQVCNTIYINIINNATDYIYITTPYLIIDYEMTCALKNASKKGVDVKIIMPHIPDKKAVFEASQSHYKTLIESGVKIFEYTPGFMHAKNFVSDDKYGIVGTINMDYRSLYLHFECAVLLYECSVIDDIKKDFISTIEESQEVSLEECTDISFTRHLYHAVLKIFAPLM